MVQDLFTNTDGTALTTHNSNWSYVKGTGDQGKIYSNGLGVAQWYSSVYSYTGSNGNASQILAKAGFRSRPCVRITGGAEGYSADLGSPSGGYFTVWAIYKDGTWAAGTSLSAALASKFADNVDHTLKVVATGTNPTVVSFYADGLYVASYSDSSSPYQSGLSGLVVTDHDGSHGTAIQLDNWSDDNSVNVDVKTVKSSGGDYTTLNAALSGESGDLVAQVRQLTIECYALEDTTPALTGSGYTSSSSYYLKVIGAVNHGGKWSTSAYRLKILDDPGNEEFAIAIISEVEYSQWIGLQIDLGASANCLGGFMGIATFQDNGVIARCIIKGSGGTYEAVGGVGINAQFPDLDDGNFYIYRNLIYDLSLLGPNTIGIANSGSEPGSPMNSLMFYIMNNTVFGRDDSGASEESGIVTDDYIPAVLKNNVAMNHYIADMGVGAATTTTAKNVTSDTSSPDGASYENKTSYANYFEDYTNKDFHLKSTDTVLKDAGDNLGQPYNIDIDGRAVNVGDWDIGADEWDGGVIMYYKTAATEAGLASASWVEYTGRFKSLGFVQIKEEYV